MTPLGQYSARADIARGAHRRGSRAIVGPLGHFARIPVDKGLRGHAPQAVGAAQQFAAAQRPGFQMQ